VIGASDEATLIDIVVRACPTRPAPEGPGDDAAALPTLAAGKQRVLSTDMLVEGTHFTRAHPPAALGWKALAVNLSDIAAMGGIPEAFVLAAALPPDMPLGNWQALAHGLGHCAEANAVYLAGGDTVRAHGPLTLTLTVWGIAPKGLLLRSGGRPGDLVMVQGPIGRSGHALHRWLAAPAGAWAAPSDEPHDPHLFEHLHPSPPLWAGPWAKANGASAGMDLSDGLAADLPRLAAASGVALDIELAQLPEDPMLAGVDPRARAAYGEDYSLVVLVPPEHAAAFSAMGFVAIGRASESAPPGAPAVLWRLDGQPIAPVVPSFAHFGAPT